MSSRIVFYGLDNRSVGETRAICNRGWRLIGDPSVESGGESPIAMSRDIAAQPWFQLGQAVTIHHPKLPAWAGILDTPWDGLLPQATLYNVEYLFALRTPDAIATLNGSTGDIVAEMIAQMNAQEETYLRIGVVDDDVVRQEALDNRPFWEQLVALLKRAGMVMQIRPVREEGRLYFYVDVLNRIGRDTSYLFHDGAGANMTVAGCTVDGTIWNRVMGIGDESTKRGRRQTLPLLEPNSIREFRMRSRNIQFQGVREESTLSAYTSEYVLTASRPTLRLRLLIEDVGDAFSNVGLGNTAIFHVSRAILPGGRRGWKGEGEMKAIGYDEKTNTVGLLVEAFL